MILDDKFYQQFKTPEDVMNSNLSKDVILMVDGSEMSPEVSSTFIKKYGKMMKEKSISVDSYITKIKKMSI